MAKAIVHRNASKYLRNLPKPQKNKIITTLKHLGENPTDFPGIKNMVGNWAGYSRIRVGNIRVIFWFNRSEDIVYVDHIGPRGDIYKK